MLCGNLPFKFFYMLKYSSKTYLIPRAYSTLKSVVYFWLLLISRFYELIFFKKLLNMFVKQWLCFCNMFSQKYNCGTPGILGKNYMELFNLRKVHRKKYFSKLRAAILQLLEELIKMLLQLKISDITAFTFKCRGEGCFKKRKSFMFWTLC